MPENGETLGWTPIRESMKAVAASKPASLLGRVWDEDTFSSLTIMTIRVAMLLAKFALSVFIARYMGLAELGVYGLIVGAAATVQTVLRGGVLPLLARDAVHQSLPEITHHLRHYGIGIVAVYVLLIPVAFAVGSHFDATILAMLALAVFFTEHLSFDIFVVINNLQYPKIANIIYSLQSALWIYLYIVYAFAYPSLRSLEFLLAFWLGGGAIALAISAWLSRSWPWRKAFAEKLERLWYGDKIKRSFRLYLTDVLGVVNYYMDRYIVTIFLSLEMTGIYVFFSQVVTATWNLINSGVLILYRPRLIQAYDSNNLAPFNRIFKSCLKRTFLSAAALAIIAGLAVPFLARYTRNEALLDYIPLLWIMLLALMFRIGETAAGAGLFAMHKDHDSFIISSISFFLILTIGSIGVLLLGVYGMVINTIIVSMVSVAYARSVWRNKPSPAKNARKEKRYA